MKFLKDASRKVLGAFGLEAKYHRIKRKHKNIPKAKYGNRAILSANEGNLLIRSKIETGKPLSIGRIGATEMALLYNYLSYSKKNEIKWNNGVRHRIWELSGVFPTDNESLSRFAKIYLEAISSVDVLGVWFNEGEELAVKKYCQKVELVELTSLEPYYFEEPWSERLQGKRVLVIHPFEDSIQQQLLNVRTLLFSNKSVLPEFEFKTMKAVQSVGKNKDGYNSWFEALEDMKTKIALLDFDIAIIGAGAYGLPLAHYVKSLGKQAIHMGGATQILFGIKGKRWDDHQVISKFYNDYWIRPNISEVIQNAEKVEDSCYW